MTGGLRAVLRSQVQSDLDLGRPERAFDRCLEAARAAPSLPERRYGQQLVATLARRVPVSARTHQRRVQLRGLGRSWPDPPPGIGSVAFPTVRGGGESAEDDCFVTTRVEVVSGELDDIPAGLEADAAAAAADAFAAARALTRSSAHFQLRFAGPTGWSGPSLGLAVALAAVSAVRGAPLSDLWVASARVSSAGVVCPVAHLPAKLSLLRAARPRARMLVARCDGGADPACAPVSDLGQAAALAFGGAVEDVDDRLHQVRRAVQEGAWVDAARAAASLESAAHLAADERVLLLSVRLAAANHAGASADQRELAPALQAAISGAGAAPEAVRALGTLAVSAVDHLRADDAHALADQALLLHPGDGKHRLHAQGPKALAERLSGRFGEALALRRANEAVARRADPTELPRCLGDLSAALLGMGDATAAIEAAEAALEEAGGLRRRTGYRDVTRPYLWYHLARARAAAGDREGALEAATSAARAHGLAPRVFAQLLLAELHGSTEAVESAWSDLPAYARGTPVVAALFERTRGRLGDRVARTALCDRFALPRTAFERAARRLPY